MTAKSTQSVFLSASILVCAIWSINESHAQPAATVGRSYPGSTTFLYDSDGAVGPRHYAEITNLNFRAISIADGVVRYEATSLLFWRKVFGEQQNGLYDPHIEFDHATGRWFAIILSRTDIFLGISDTDDPAAGWKGFKIDADPTRLRWPDYPYLGIDGAAVYIRATMLGFDGSIDSGRTLLVIPKSDLVATTPTLARMTRLTRVDPAGQRLPLAPQGSAFYSYGFPQIDFLGTSSDGLLFAAPFFSFSASSNSWSILNFTYQTMSGQQTGIATPFPWVNLVGSHTIAQSSVPLPKPDSVGVSQPGTTQKLGINTGNNQIRVGDFLYSVGNLPFNTYAIVYTKYRVSSAMVVDSGIIWDPNYDYAEPSICANPRGDVVIAFTRSSSSSFTSLCCVAGQPNTQGKLVFSAPLLLKAGSNILDETVVKFPNGAARFSDYSSVVSLYPGDHSRFWVGGPYISARNTASIWISEVVFPSDALPPVITSQPVARRVLAGEGVTFTVAANGPNLSYQWLFNETLINGAVASTYSIAAVASANAGTYRVRVTNANGTVTSESAALFVDPAIAFLSNLSVRGRAGSGSETLIVGVTVGGSPAAKSVLVRGVGPTLSAFGVNDPLADPVLTLLNGSATIGTNDDWGTASGIAVTSASVGAFALPAGSLDAALIDPALNSGSYTIQVTGKGGATGNALVEVYDIPRAPSLVAANSRLTNLSTRTLGGTGSDTLIVGFSVSGFGSRRLLIRGVGPALAAFGVTGTMADPKLELYAGPTKIAENDNWDTSTRSVHDGVGAFALPQNSRDAALISALSPGNYTVHATGGVGVVLVEIYELATP